MTYVIREIRQDERPLLKDFLYEAIFIPKGTVPPPKTIIEQPELQVYIADFGKKDDCCLVAEVAGKVIGAVWTRIMDDYGHVADDIPSFAIALYPEYRGKGIGTALMKEMLTLLKRKGYQKASLSVQKENPAYHLYLRMGFKVIADKDEEYLMCCDL